jgi:aconitase B
MTDVIHKVLNDIVDEWAIMVVVTHTRMSKGVAFGADSEL